MKTKPFEAVENILKPRVAEGNPFKSAKGSPDRETQHEVDLSMDQQKELNSYLHEKKLKYIEQVFSKRN